jgi:hypothetical protein
MAVSKQATHKISHGEVISQEINEVEGKEEYRV